MIAQLWMGPTIAMVAGWWSGAGSSRGAAQCEQPGGMACHPCFTREVMRMAMCGAAPTTPEP
eukprot:8458025-Pyramimonas_sp.AAC.1